MGWTHLGCMVFVLPVGVMRHGSACEVVRQDIEREAFGGVQGGVVVGALAAAAAVACRNVEGARHAGDEVSGGGAILAEEAAVSAVVETPILDVGGRPVEQVGGVRWQQGALGAVAQRHRGLRRGVCGRHGEWLPYDLGSGEGYARQAPGSAPGTIRWWRDGPP
ncbi:hypothetical protein GCM10017687_55670 [Streptomyces echinatus]